MKLKQATAARITTIISKAETKGAHQYNKNNEKTNFAERTNIMKLTYKTGERHKITIG